MTAVLQSKVLFPPDRAARSSRSAGAAPPGRNPRYPSGVPGPCRRFPDRPFPWLEAAPGVPAAALFPQGAAGAPPLNPPVAGSPCDARPGTNFASPLAIGEPS